MKLIYDSGGIENWYNNPFDIDKLCKSKRTIKPLTTRRKNMKNFTKEELIEIIRIKHEIIQDLLKQLKSNQ